MKKRVNEKAFRLYAKLDVIPLHGYAEKAEDGTPLGKSPVESEWATKPKKNAPTVIKNCVAANANMGFRPGASDLIVDVDPRNGGTESFERLMFEAGLDPASFPKTVTGSGGFHLYGKKPADLRTRKKLKAYPGIEFISKGGQVLAAGCVHPNGNSYVHKGPAYDDAPEWPRELLELIERKDEPTTGTAGGEVTPDELAEMLKRLNVTDFRDHDEWLQIMMAAHAATAGDGLDVFEEWSTSDPQHSDAGDSIRLRWNSLTPSGGITVKTLNKILRDHGAADAQAGTVSAADDFKDAPSIDPADLLTEDDFKSEEQSDGGWYYGGKHFKRLKQWQWIAAANQFVHDDGKQFYDDKQFNRMFGKLTPKGTITKEIDKGNVPMKKFARQVYIPNSPPVIQYEGKTAFNIWRASAMTPKPGDYQWFLDHVAMLFPKMEKSQGYLLDYMAQLIQRPEVKIHFALLLQSIEGVGKGALARILRRMIGDRNCIEPSNDEVTKHWTGWQEGAQLAIVNELMVDGRADVYNRLKSPITEDTLRIEKKFGNTFTIPNHMNLFCMTNFKDALPIKEHDRRWLVLESPAAKQPPDYYATLFANIADDDKVAAVMAYLLARPITLDPKAPAPWTAAKGDMQTRARTDHEADLQELYDRQCDPFDFPLLTVNDLVGAIRRANKHAKNAFKDAYSFLDTIKAAKLRRYRKHAPGTTNAQLYAVRDHDQWQKADPVDAARAYFDHTTGDKDSAGDN